VPVPTAFLRVVAPVEIDRGRQQRSTGGRDRIRPRAGRRPWLPGSPGHRVLV